MRQTLTYDFWGLHKNINCAFPLRTVHFAIFDSYLHYGCQVWGQNKNASTKEIASIQDKALRIISFKDCSAATKDLCIMRKKL